MAKRRDHRVTAADIVRFFDKYIYIPEGRWVGQRLVLDPWQRAAGNRAPDKRKATHRIDGMVALLMPLPGAPTKPPTIDVEAFIAWGRRDARHLAASLHFGELAAPAP